MYKSCFLFTFLSIKKLTYTVFSVWGPIYMWGPQYIYLNVCIIFATQQCKMGNFIYYSSVLTIKMLTL